MSAIEHDSGCVAQTDVTLTNLCQQQMHLAILLTGSGCVCCSLPTERIADAKSCTLQRSLNLRSYLWTMYTAKTSKHDSAVLAMGYLPYARRRCSEVGENWTEVRQ